jgi:hypothetical protein
MGALSRLQAARNVDKVVIPKPKPPSYMTKKDSKKGYRIKVDKSIGTVVADLSEQFLVHFDGAIYPEYILKRKVKHTILEG